MADNEDREIRQLLGEDPIRPNMDFSNLVVVDGIPVVDEEKSDKMEKFLVKRFEKLGAPAPKSLKMFLQEKNGKKVGNGWCVAEFANGAEAEVAIQSVDGKAFDKQHKMSLVTFNRFMELMEVPEELGVDDRDLDHEKGLAELRASLYDWVLEAQGREQFLLRAGPDCMIAWNNSRDPKNPYELVYSQVQDNAGDDGPEQLWADRSAVWSPLGSMVMTRHQQGIRLWGGAGFHRVAQFKHHNVDFTAFSPKERFLVTGTSGRPVGDEPSTVVWNTFTESAVHTMGPLPLPDPRFRWSPDDQYMAVIEADRIRLFQTHEDRFEELAPLMVPGVQDARWSPEQNILAFTVPEKDNSPFKVSLVSIPSRQVLRERTLYNVLDGQLEWQTPGGDFLSVKMVRSKKGKPSSTNVEIFRLREKDVPVESIEFADPVHDLRWEPHGRRLAVIHGDTQSNRTVEILQLLKTKVKSVFKLTGKDTNRIFWSPFGTYAVLVQQEKGHMDFYDAQNGEVISAGREHFMMNGLEWSPDGQYVLTSCCTRPGDDENWRLASEAGYKIWTKLGEQQVERKVEHCYKIEWRPRPPSPLTAEEQAEIRTQLREKYWKRFEAEDAQLAFQLQGDEAKERAALREQWKAFRAACAQVYAEERAIRQKRWNEDVEPELISVETTVDSEIDTKTDVYAH